MKKNKLNKDLNDETFNIVESIVKSKNLYKKLIVLTHPDKHPQNINLATELSELVNKNRYNYRELLKLEKIITNIK